MAVHVDGYSKSDARSHAVKSHTPILASIGVVAECFVVAAWHVNRAY